MTKDKIGTGRKKTKKKESGEGSERMNLRAPPSASISKREKEPENK